MSVWGDIPKQRDGGYVTVAKGDVILAIADNGVAYLRRLLLVDQRLILLAEPAPGEAS